MFRLLHSERLERGLHPVFVAGLKQRQSLKYVLVYISGSVSNDTSQINQHY